MQMVSWEVITDCAIYLECWIKGCCFAGAQVLANLSKTRTHGWWTDVHCAGAADSSVSGWLARDASRARAEQAKTQGTECAKTNHCGGSSEPTEAMKIASVREQTPFQETL